MVRAVRFGCVASRLDEINTFGFNGISLRCVTIDGLPWFLVTDLAAALGFEVGSATRHLRGVINLDEQRHVLKSTVTSSDVGFPNPGALAVSESGLYKMLLRAQSTRPTAKVFQEWVTRDVLSAIRRDGAYIMGKEKFVTGEMSEDELICVKTWKLSPQYVVVRSGAKLLGMVW